jgi:hypothetical protein
MSATMIHFFGRMIESATASPVLCNVCKIEKAQLFCNRCEWCNYCGTTCQLADKHEAVCFQFRGRKELLAAASAQLKSGTQGCRSYSWGHQTICIFHFPKTVLINQAPLDGTGVAYGLDSAELKNWIVRKLKFNRFLGGDTILSLVSQHRC